MRNQKRFPDISSKNDRGNQKTKISKQNQTTRPSFHSSIKQFHPSIHSVHPSVHRISQRQVHVQALFTTTEKRTGKGNPREKLLEPRQPPSSWPFYFLYQPLSVFFFTIPVLSPFRESHQSIKPRRREWLRRGGLTPNPPGNQPHQNQTPHQNEPQNRQPHFSTA